MKVHLARFPQFLIFKEVSPVWVFFIKNYFFDAKYLSDISFSSNDYSLNTLLNILPQKLYIHVLDKTDEFIDTIQKIFKSRAVLCFNCDICNLYKNTSQLVHSDNLDF